MGRLGRVGIKPTHKGFAVLTVIRNLLTKQAFPSDSVCKKGRFLPPFVRYWQPNGNHVRPPAHSATSGGTHRRQLTDHSFSQEADLASSPHRIEQDNSKNTGIVRQFLFQSNPVFGAVRFAPVDWFHVSLTCVLRQFALPGR
jgi:hypothetical protein